MSVYIVNILCFIKNLLQNTEPPSFKRNKKKKLFLNLSKNVLVSIFLTREKTQHRNSITRSTIY